MDFSQLPEKLKKAVMLLGEGILNSYSQIFFSNNKLFAVLLLVATLVDWNAGISGLIAIIAAQIAVLWNGFDKEQVRNGLYSYNSLMVGLAAGSFYTINVPFVVILTFISVFTVFVTIWMASNTIRTGVPFLSVPFLVGAWIVLLSAGQFSALELIVREPLSIKEAFFFNQRWSLPIEQTLNGLELPEFISVYLKSLGAVMFQSHILAGLVIMIGLLYYSRIAFTLSILGYAVGYYFYIFLQGDVSHLYTNIGFNFILTAIALGGFFIIPSWRSYVLVVLTIPLIAMLIAGLHNIFSLIFKVPMYSLPFNLVVMITLLTLQLRTKTRGMELTKIQYYSPEKNLYKFYNYMQRFASATFVKIALPFYGEWRISQGHEGEITHKGHWKEAWDFDITGEDGRTFQLPGTQLKDYYCYDKPVLAPADGWIMKIEDHISDNEVGDTNLEQNWGNSIVIKHNDYLYSSLSHVKEGTFEVKEGDYVKKGDIIGRCGSSGRSPEPHLHFQLQGTPHIGAKTIKHPISYYMTQLNGQHRFHAFEIPEEGERVANVATTKLLKDAFHLVPGKTFEWQVEGIAESVKWEVQVNLLNNSYIYCHNTGGKAYFEYNDALFYFTDFEGDRSGLLHQFYVGMHRVLLGYYKEVTLDDQLQVNGFFPGIVKVLHDFTAPFFHYLKVDYQFAFGAVDDPQNPKEITIETTANAYMLGNETKAVAGQFQIDKKGVRQFSVSTTNKKVIATCIEE